MKHAGTSLIIVGALMVLFYPSMWVYGKVSQVRLHQQWQNQQSVNGIDTKTPQIFGRLVIPRIWMDMIVLQGVDNSSLAQGPGHFPGTADPGEGNCCIIGHLNVDGSPFKDLDRLRPGDDVVVQGDGKLGMYKVSHTEIVLPTHIGVLRQSGPPRLTLVTCMPGAKMRYVVTCKQVAVH